MSLKVHLGLKCRFLIMSAPRDAQWSVSRPGGIFHSSLRRSIGNNTIYQAASRCQHFARRAVASAKVAAENHKGQFELSFAPELVRAIGMLA